MTITANKVERFGGVIPSTREAEPISSVSLHSVLKELLRMAGEIKNLNSLKNTLEELSNTAHSTVQQFRADAGDLLETLKFVKGFSSEVKQINQEIRSLFAAETNGSPSDRSPS